MRAQVRSLAAALACASLLAAPAWALDASKVPTPKQTKAGLYLDAKEAYALKQKMGERALFVDVRTRAEVSYLGMPVVADAHIPYAEHPADAPWDDKNARFAMDANSDFGPELARRMAQHGLNKSDVLILMCRSGDRSARAVNLATELGYTRVYTVVDGYEGDLAKEGPQAGQRVVNGWKNAGLPWTYKLDKTRLYIPNN